jgi:membrane-bound lytic murein transglycosylase D
VGQKLIVSAAASSSAASQTSQSSTVQTGDYTTYVVQSGDSFYTIAKKYPGISAQNIMDFNNLSSSKIRPGMTIRIPKK